MSVVVTAAEKTRIGEDFGWLLRSRVGDSKLIWRNGELHASQMSATRFDPPIVLLKPKESKASWNWKGVVTIRAKQSKATASLDQELVTLKFGGIDRETLRVRLKMTNNGVDIELITWYEKGVGILQQEQRNNGELVSSLVLTGSN